MVHPHARQAGPEQDQGTQGLQGRRVRRRPGHHHVDHGRQAGQRLGRHFRQHLRLPADRHRQAARQDLRQVRQADQGQRRPGHVQVLRAERNRLLPGERPHVRRRLQLRHLGNRRRQRHAQADHERSADRRPRARRHHLPRRLAVLRGGRADQLGLLRSQHPRLDGCDRPVLGKAHDRRHAARCRAIRPAATSC